MSGTTQTNLVALAENSKDERLQKQVNEFIQSNRETALLDSLERSAASWSKTLSLPQAIVNLERYLTTWKLNLKSKKKA